MRQYLGSAVLREQVARFWVLCRPVGAICHGVIVLARTGDRAIGRSVLADRRHLPAEIRGTDVLPWPVTPWAAITHVGPAR
jgi:putative intracellular protease/amidase